MKGQENSKILIVDDQHKNIQVLGSLLKDEGYIVGVAMNGKQAYKTLLENDNFDLILLDVNMPEMDGFEACKAIRKHENLKGIPIIFLTALVEPQDIVKGFELGGQDYLTKPFNSSELLVRVKTHLELKHSKDKLKEVNNWLEEKVAERTKELNIANKKLLTLDNAKTDFLNIISHEIRTPLNGIFGALDIVEEFELPEDVESMLNILKASSNRLQDFSYKALDISLINTKGQDALSMEKTNLYDTLQVSINKYKAKAEEKNIITVSKNYSIDPNTLIDELYIEKCFSYLVDNAVKFAEANSVIDIKLTETNEHLVVSIEDEGEHFPDGYDITSIRPFNTKNHVDQNPALSLFLSKLIIETHGGKLDFSNTQKGVIIQISLPKQT